MSELPYLEHFDRLSARLAEVAAGHLETPIPFLGDWAVRDLVGHTGQVYAFCTANLLAQSTEPTSPGAEAAVPEGDEILGWFGERRDVVRDALATADLTVEGWTFAGIHPGSFWLRRMAQETAVHTWDVETACGARSDVITAELAVDGINEYATVGLQHSSSRPKRDYPAETLHLHCTDTAGEWMFGRADDGTVAVTHEHGKGDAAVKGTAVDLLAWIWGRPVDEDRLEVFGDAAVAQAWQDLAP